MGEVRTGSLVLLLVVVVCGCCVGGRGEDEVVRASLVGFLRALAGGDEQAVRDLGWNVSVDPCGGNGSTAAWGGVRCHVPGSGLIKSITIEGRGLSGTVDAGGLCAAPALRLVSLRDNALRGELPPAVAACAQLTHLYVGGNRLSGALPAGLGRLRNLTRLNVSSNAFSGELPGDLANTSSLRALLAENNHFNGTIPDFDLTAFDMFNLSNNSLTGPVPEKTGRFGANSFLQNSGLCGSPFLPPCPSSPPPPPPPPPSTVTESEGKKSSRRAAEKVVMVLGYVLLGAAILVFVAYKLRSKKRRKRRAGGGIGMNKVGDESKLTATTAATSASDTKRTSDYSAAAAAAGGGEQSTASSLVMLRRSGRTLSAAAKELRFEDLLKSPAELLGRGRLGSTYKVVLPDGAALAVKRIKDVTVPAEEFRRRMERIGRARHGGVLPPMAFYCAMQEKLVVYEFQPNGSLAKLLHGTIESSQGAADWPSRLNIAANVAEGLAFMHSALRGLDSDDAGNNDGSIGHGNLKASNIVFTAGMEPCISEYGLTTIAAAPDALHRSGDSVLRADVRDFGVLLLELLTGKAPAQSDGSDLARWVNSVIREEWTAEVFDKALLAGGGSQERMVDMLKVALHCTDLKAATAAAPLSMAQVAGMVNAIREEDERSVSSEA